MDDDDELSRILREELGGDWSDDTGMGAHGDDDEVPPSLGDLEDW